jgi:carbamoyltransferase
MARVFGKYLPHTASIAKTVTSLARPVISKLCEQWHVVGHFQKNGNQEALSQASKRIQNQETVRLLALNLGCHNSGVAYVEASQKNGIQLIRNNEEERFSSIKHDQSFPQMALDDIIQSYQNFDHILCSWDYPELLSTGTRVALESLPASLTLIRKEASPHINFPSVIRQLSVAASRIQKTLKLSSPPTLLCQRHHDCHAALAFGLSPFASGINATPLPGQRYSTLIAVFDGFGDDGCVSIYGVERKGGSPTFHLIHHVPDIFDSLGLYYCKIEHILS